MVNLYSDTQTRPTAAMRRAMAEAEVGDEQSFADPTVNALCARVAELLGLEAGVFLPSGTMCKCAAKSRSGCTSARAATRPTCTAHRTRWWPRRAGRRRSPGQCCARWSGTAGCSPRSGCWTRCGRRATATSRRRSGRAASTPRGSTSRKGSARRWAPCSVADAPALVGDLEAEGVKMGALGPRTVRAVTHLDVDRPGVVTAVAAVRAALGA